MWHADGQAPEGTDPPADPPTEADVAASDDARAGRALVDARVAQHSEADRAAFWEAVGRCFGGGKPPDHRGPERG